MPRCAFLSISNTEGWFIDDDLVHPFLHELGWEVKNIPWNEKTDWNKWDLVIIRSPWDYQQHLEEFMEVLQKIEDSTAILLNPLDIVKQNIHKGYLFELAEKGVELVPTQKFSNLDESLITESFEKFKSNQLVIKPLVGANADDTFWINISHPLDWEKPLEVFQEKEGMIQPFMSGIVKEGEFSLIYLNGELSHTILKTVGIGDFRVQEEHGGGVIAIPNPEPELVKAAGKAMKALSSTPFYARVDLVRTRQGSFALMELELIEPCLYFRFDPNSPKKFAALIHDYYSNLSN
ncbi:hypothetical protein GYM62_04485 [Algoriphagus sp. NBT04N3]|uniref:ATP-grasp domain-containing protein n=1 Tax=Algoriphagus sp. NBT04N3 TaxID=2705473 RepID=UPI001C624D3E|nr:hypothetical protein [Algoriphagus sp. NBT04N3]QYH38090.1 hypothetical protein GYM62_04485 [Algoriphagus sp. NBT04N3]